MWIFSSSICTLWLFFDVLLCTTSIYHLATVSILRFIAIQFPLKNNFIKSKRLSIGVTVLLWILSTLISSSVLFLGYRDSSNVLDKKNGCHIRNNTFIVVGSIFSFVIPIFVMILMFILMARKLRQQLEKLDLRPIGYKNNNSTNISQSVDLDTVITLRRHVPKQANSNSNNSSSVQDKLKNKFQKCPSRLSLNNSLSCDYDSGVSNRRSFQSQYQFSKEQNDNNNNKKKKKKSKNKFFYRASFYLMNMSNNGTNLPDPKAKSEIQSETKALQVLVLVLITFIVSWLPFTLINISSVFLTQTNSSIHIILTCLAYLGYVSSAVNPLIYTSFNKKFRRNFIEIISCGRKSAHYLESF